MNDDRIISMAAPPAVVSFAAVAGSKEGQGPMGHCFDRVEEDPYFGEQTWEKAESALQSLTLSLALSKGGISVQELGCVAAGDLINQCTGSAFAMRDINVPFLGLYGACSTMAESLLTMGMAVGGGFVTCGAAVTSSHFSTAERQFRFPLSYGGVRPPAAQRTCTASGAVVLSAKGEGVHLVGGCIGRIVDLGVTDANNMGAAMAPAAADTIARYLRATGTSPEMYDCIVTGDLGDVGSPLLLELLQKEGLDIAARHRDCGSLMFDNETQDTHAGGSGCGCSASLLCGYFLPKLKSGEFKRILFGATGALLSPTSSQQGESIPGICHLVELCSE